MKRLDFLMSLGAMSLAPAFSWAGILPEDIIITRIVRFDLVSYRPKMVGKNSQKDVHGDSAFDRMVRIYTNRGFEGLGRCNLGEEELIQLLGKNPMDLFRSDEKSMTMLGTQTMPLWDLAGNILGKPVCELLGGKPKKIPAYDGSIYFADLLPEYVGRPMDRMKEEIDLGMKLGHRAFKVKTGRGYKWMPTEEGFKRDIDVLRTIRSHGGNDLVLGVDANNGWDLQRAKRFVTETSDLNLAFVEEPFPETIEECLELKQHMKDEGLSTYLADGETQPEVQLLKPFIDARAIDVLQGDMRRFGIEQILTEAEWASEKDLLVAPHNWGGITGYHMQLHIACAIDNFYIAEHDILSNDILHTEGYDVKNGFATVPEAPGFGYKLDEEKFSRHEIKFDLKT